MDSTMEGMLDTYLLETEALLDKLDEMLIADEKVGDFSTDDVNEIFRIMHTIKGSSAMMEFTPLSNIAHHIEDMFFFIRDKGIDSLSGDQKSELFDLMFRSEDFLRSGLEKVKAGEELDNNVEEFAGSINAFLAKISGKAPADSAPVVEAGDSSKPSAENRKLPKDDKAKKFIHVFLDEGIGMENLRAFMIVNAIKEFDLEFRYYPADMDSNPETAQTIIDEGFFLAFDSDEDCDKGEKILREQSHILSYEPVEAKKEEAKTEAKSASTDNSAAPKASKEPAAAQQTAQQKAAAPVKQSLISVNLQKLDSLNDLVGEIVITESMVTSSPVLRMLPQESLDNFMKSARQLRKLTDDLQDIAMSLRMVSISGVFQKMNRIVRDMKQKLGKDVKLTIIGEDTEVDKTIVDSIQDPLMHIVRNSMDHGI